MRNILIFAAIAGVAAAIAIYLTSEDISTSELLDNSASDIATSTERGFNAML